MVSMSMEAQTSPVCSVPSPEAANLGTYGSVPVSLFTGIPDISVPIHEMRVRWLRHTYRPGSPR